MIRTRTLAIAGGGLAVLLAAAVAPFASTAPDGLERVAAQQGIVAAEPARNAAPIPGYAMPGIASGRIATGAAGVVGTLTVLALGAGLARLLRRRQP